MVDAVQSAPAGSGASVLLEEYDNLLRTAASAREGRTLGHLVRLLRTREAISGRTDVLTDSTAVSRLGVLDTQFKRLIPAFEDAMGVPSLLQLQAIAPTENPGWWWRLTDFLPGGSFWGHAVAAVLLAGATGLVAEIGRRFFADGPDFAGVFYILLQGTLTLLAGSTLAGQGAQILERWLDRKGWRRRRHSLVKGAFAGVALTAALLAFGALPWVAEVYNRAGVRRDGEGDVRSAIHDFRKAASLAPEFASAHYNLGRTYESILQHDLAQVEFQTALQIDPRMYVAANSLARLLLRAENDAAGALELVDPAIERIEQEVALSDELKRARVALQKNRGWANLLAGNVGQAKADLTAALSLSPTQASAHCLMGMVLEKLKQPAIVHWHMCIAESEGARDVERVWLATANERLTGSE